MIPAIICYDSLLIQKYFQLYRAKPTDMAYKGFEIAYYFTNILAKLPHRFYVAY